MDTELVADAFEHRQAFSGGLEAFGLLVRGGLRAFGCGRQFFEASFFLWRSLQFIFRTQLLAVFPEVVIEVDMLGGVRNQSRSTLCIETLSSTYTYPAHRCYRLNHCNH